MHLGDVELESRPRQPTQPAVLDLPVVDHGLVHEAAVRHVDVCCATAPRSGQESEHLLLDLRGLSVAGQHAPVDDQDAQGVGDRHGRLLLRLQRHSTTPMRLREPRGKRPYPRSRTRPLPTRGSDTRPRSGRR